MDSIQDFFPKGGDPERPIGMIPQGAEQTISDMIEILQQVFTDKDGKSGISVDKCTDCEPADENILDLSIGEASERAAGGFYDSTHYDLIDVNICPKCNKEQRKSFKYVILEAPTGAGKSWIAATLALWKKNVTILTSQKGLQDQYKSDFPFVKTVRGRDNYDCIQLLNQEKCSQGHCFSEKEKKPCEFWVSKKEFEVANKGSEDEEINYIGDKEESERCKFYEQKSKGERSSFCVYNYPMFMFSSSAKDEPEEEPELGHKTLLICDEAHDFENYLKANLGLEIKDTYATKIDRKDLQDKIKLVKITSEIDEILKIVKELITGYGDRIKQIEEHVECSLWLYSKNHMARHPDLRCQNGHKRPQKKKDCCKNARDFLRAYGKSRRCFKCKDHWECKEDHNKLNHLLLKSMKENLEKLEMAHTEITGDKKNFFISKAGTDEETEKFVVQLHPLELQTEAKKVYESETGFTDKHEKLQSATRGMNELAGRLEVSSCTPHDELP